MEAQKLLTRCKDKRKNELPNQNLFIRAKIGLQNLCLESEKEMDTQVETHIDLDNEEASLDVSFTIERDYDRTHQYASKIKFTLWETGAKKITLTCKQYEELIEIIKDKINY